MRRHLNSEDKAVLEGLTYSVGDAGVLEDMAFVPPRTPFHAECCDFLDAVSKILLSCKEAKAFPDVVTLGFWMRRASVNALKKRFSGNDGNFRLGRGTVFHIAPSNVPVNYAYTLAAGLLTGNANVVRIPTKDFPQISIVNRAVREALSSHESMRPYICLVRYERNQAVNDILSAMADVRIIWGGDETIRALRQSPLAPRASEITFATRYSLAVIDSEAYLRAENKARIASDFYNDTYLTDQNACTSPKLVVWLGAKIAEAKQIFWAQLHELAAKKYAFQPITGIHKLTSAYRILALLPGSRLTAGPDNILTRLELPSLPEWLLDFDESAGFFLEYDCGDILDLKNICNDTRCQTVGYWGDPQCFQPLLRAGIRGIDRIVTIGKTMDFDFVWDGYNLSERLTRIIQIV